MADKQVKVRNALDVVNTKRGWQWHMHDHAGNRIASSSQYYASSFAAKRAAQRAAKRMQAWGTSTGVLQPTVVGIDPAQPHGDFSATVPAAKQAEATPAPRKRFGIFGRG